MIFKTFRASQHCTTTLYPFNFVRFWIFKVFDLMKTRNKMLKLQLLVLIVVVCAVSFCSVSGEEDIQGLQEDEVHIGAYGYTCTSECRKKGYSYNWCYAKHPKSNVPGITYWDYCSKHVEYDYRGRRCWHEHGCGNHGYDYKWCYTGDDGSSWGYCGINAKKRANE